MSICLIDTSVFCNVLDVPGRNQQRPAVIQMLKDLANAKTVLLLPLAAILETGNHIGQLANGAGRRQSAGRFVVQVKAALEGKAPWIPTQFIESSDLQNWIDKFPDDAARGLGLGDLSIIQEWERQRQLHPYKRVFIWAYDEHLAAYDTGAQ